MEVQNRKIEVAYGNENLKLIYEEILKQEFMKFFKQEKQDGVKNGETI